MSAFFIYISASLFAAHAFRLIAPVGVTTLVEIHICRCGAWFRMICCRTLNRQGVVISLVTRYSPLSISMALQVSNLIVCVVLKVAVLCIDVILRGQARWVEAAEMGPHIQESSMMVPTSLTTVSI